MIPRHPPLALAAVCALLAGCATAGGPPARPTAAPAREARATAAEVTAEQRIRYYSERAARSPWLYPMYTQLGLACLDRARELHDPTWLARARVAEAADIICAHRESDDELPMAFPHRYAPSSVVRISTSVVRERIAAGLPFRRLLPPGVFRYIVENRLYGLR